MKITFFIFVIHGFMLLFTTVVAAVDENTINPNAEKFVLNSSVQYLDNYHPRLNDGISATALSAGINGKLLSMHQGVWLQASYSGAYTQFKLDENEVALEDQFSHYNIELLSRLFMGNKWYVDLQGTHRNVDYLLGTGIAKFRPATIAGDSVSSNEIAASVVYGSGINNSDGRESKRFIKLALSHLNQDYADKNTYSNLFDLTRDTAEIGLNFKISDITQFETSFEFEKVDFVDDSQLDNDVYRLLLGFEWQGTGQTHLRLLVGGYKRVYQLMPDNQGFLAELDAEYTPRNNLSITLKGSQTTTTGVIENSLDTVTKSASFAINYGYKEHIKFIVKAHINNTQFEQTGEERTSVDSAVGLSSEVLVTDHSTVSLTLQRESLEYDLLGLDYSQNKVELNCRYGF
jgi:hypothetical protein